MSWQTRPQHHGHEGDNTLFPAQQQGTSHVLDSYVSHFPMPDDVARFVLAEPFFPAIDIVETEDAIEVSAEVPGVKADDLDVMIAGRTLILKGRKRGNYQEVDNSHHLIERRYGSFCRQIPLGFVPKNEEIAATFANGVLKLSISKPETAKANIQKINIKKS